MRIQNSSQIMISAAKLKLEAISSRVDRIEPHKLLSLYSGKLDHNQSKLAAAVQSQLVKGTNRLDLASLNLSNRINVLLNNKAQRLNLLGNKLSAISPKAVLKRGYAVVQKQGKIVTNSEDLSSGDKLNISLYSGNVSASVD